MKNISYKFFVFTIFAVIVILMFANFLTPFLYTIYSSDQYLGMHTFLELFSIFIAFATFLMGWLTKDGLEGPSGRFVTILSASLLAVGCIDLFHTLSFKGMPVFITASSYQKATFFWLFGRYCAVAGFLTAFGFLRCKFSSPNGPLFSIGIIAINLILIISGLLLSTRYLYLIPPLFVEGTGLTALKNHLEYILIMLYFGIFALLYRYRAWFKETTFDNLTYFLLFTVGSEVAFTFYKSVFDTYNLIGHVYKILAYWFLFKAIYLSAIVNHIYVLSEMGKMSAQLLSDRGTVNTFLEIQMVKLSQLIPTAERIAFFVKEEENIFRADFVSGKYTELISLRDKIYFQDILQVLGTQTKVFHRPYMLLTGLNPNNYTPEIGQLWQADSQLLYIPLITEEQFYGFILLHRFSRLRSFSEEDVEKALVFQKFATLAIAQVQHRETIARLSYEDSMTHLPNRRYFFEHLADAQYEAARYGIPFTLIFLDMNNLKHLNDNYGHAAGDEALLAIAEKLKKTVRASDVAARLGGDEFAIILKHAALEEGRQKVDEYRQHFASIDLPTYSFAFSLAVGGATYPTEADTQDALLRMADDRMYEHKREMKAAQKRSSP